jgi:CheY-like chemotaxis protein
MASILVIDDIEEFRQLMAGALRMAGHAVDTAADGSAGLALYNKKPYDLVITDIVMPAMNGLELVEALRLTTPRPLVIAMSGDSKYSTSIYLPTAKVLGVERILAKPIQPDVLLSTVADVLKLAPQATAPFRRLP